MLAQYDANDIVLLEWVFILLFVSVNWFLFIDFDFFWNSRMDQIS